MTCPFCRGALRAEAHPNVEVDRCPNCTALWFDRDELDAYVRDRETARARLAGEVREGKASSFRCPRGCTTTLLSYTLGIVAAHLCPSCRGIALESFQLGHAAKYSAAHAVAAAPDALFLPSALEALLGILVGGLDV